MHQYPWPSLVNIKRFLQRLKTENCGYVHCHHLSQFELHHLPIESLQDLASQSNPRPNEVRHD